MSLTTREKICKYCKVSRRNRRGDNIEYGSRIFQMNRLLENTPDEDLERIIADKDLGIGVFIKDAESTEEMRVKNKKTKAKKAAKELSSCECGCGAKVPRKFKQGHDMKLKSRLRKAAKGEGAEAKEAKAELKRRGWA